MAAVISWVVLIGCGLLPAYAAAQGDTTAPVEAAICELAQHPERFADKRIEVRGTVESGVADLPAGLMSESCGAEVKFFMPDDERMARLVKSRGFRKLVKEVKRHPVVEATVSGLFRVTGTHEKPTLELSLEAVESVAVKR